MRALIADIAMIRLFLLIENHLDFIAIKILAGAPYLDGTTALRTSNPASMKAARVDMLRLHRKQPLRYLKWTNATDCKKNIQHTISSNDPLFGTLSRHDLVFQQMRAVRNHVAHGTTDTRNKYRAAIRPYWGQVNPYRSSGSYLLSAPPLQSRSLLEIFTISARTFIKETVRA